MVANLVNRHDVGVVKVGGKLGLPAKTSALGGGGHRSRENHLQRHDALQGGVLGLVNDAHSAPGDLLKEHVVAHVFLSRRNGAGPRRVVRVAGRLRAVSGSRTGQHTGNRLGRSRRTPAHRWRLARWREIRFGEGGVNRALKIGKPREVVGRKRALATFAAELDLQGQELAKHRQSLFRAAARQVILDSRLLVTSEARLEKLARFVYAPGLRQRGVRASGGRISRHQAAPLSASQVLRMRSSRRATVRRAQPSSAAISSQV